MNKARLLGADEPAGLGVSLAIYYCEENLRGYSGFSGVSTSIAKDLGSNSDG